MGDWENLKLDYEQTAAHFRSLAEIRFKLLAAVPTLAGVAFGTVLAADEKISTGVGLIGAVVTFGLILYELRNSELYDAAMQRMRSLEGKLGFPATRSVEPAPGGVHRERPGRNYKFFGVRIVHDRALGVIYGTSFGAWIFVFAHGLWRLLSLPTVRGRQLIPLVLAITSGVLVLLGFMRHDKDLEPVRKLKLP
jgi:hypothetical protein